MTTALTAWASDEDDHWYAVAGLAAEVIVVHQAERERGAEARADAGGGR